MTRKTDAPKRGVRPGEHQISAVIPPGWITESVAARRYGVSVDRLRALLRRYPEVVRPVEIAARLVDEEALETVMTMTSKEGG